MRQPRVHRETRSAAASSASRRDRERLARRGDIIRAARDVFAEKGFDKATLEEIAERAEFGKGTVYNYFESKEILFSAAMVNLFDDVCTISREAAQAGTPVRESFTAYAQRMIEYYRANYAFCRMLMREWVRPEAEHSEKRLDAVKARVPLVAEPLASLLKSAMRRGEIRRADPMVFAVTFVGLVHHYYMHVVSLAPPAAPREVKRHADMVVGVFFDGISRTPSGR